MALTDTQKDPVAAAPSRTQIAPAWVAGLFIFGLILLYVGQSGAADALWQKLAFYAALLLLVGSTALRLLPQYRGQGAAAKLSSLLIGLQLLGLASVGLCLLGTDAGLRLIGVAADSPWATALTVTSLIGLAVSALSLILAEVALHPMREAEAVEVSRVWAAAASGAALAAAGAYGSLFVFAAAQAEAQADFSYFKTSEPGEATVKLVQKLSTPLQVTGFFPAVSEVRKEVQGYLNKLEQRSGNVEVTLVDRYLEPKRAQEARVTQDGTLVLQHGENSRTLVIGTDIDKARSKLVQLDKEFNTRLNKIAREQRIAYLTVGHGELNDAPKGTRKAEGRTGEVMRQLLEQQNYRVRDLGLNQGLSSAVPDDADVVLVLGPVQPFTPEEIGTLKRYADAGGKIFMALDADSVVQSEDGAAAVDVLAAKPAEPAKDVLAASSDKPGKDVPAAAPAGSAAADSVAPEAASSWLTQLAAAVGANFDPTLLADEKKHVVRRHNPSDRTLLQTNRFSTHASVSTLSRNSARAGVVAFGAGHFRAAKDGPYRTDVTVRTFSSAFPDKNQNFQLDEGEASKTYNLGVAITKRADRAEGDKKPPAAPPKEGEPAEKDKKSEGEDQSEEAAEDPSQHEMRAFVFADADAFSDLVLSRAVTNRMLAFDAVRWLVGEESLAGEVESEEDVRIEPSKTTDTAWFYTSIFGMPALVLGAGLFVSSRARRATRKPVGGTRK